MRNSLKQFVNMYPIQRTLSFQLIPVGKTDSYIQERGLIREDETRAEQYKKVKKIIDEYHKKIIDRVLGDIKKGPIVRLDDLEEYERLYNIKSKTQAESKEFDKIHEKMRKEITAKFNADEKFKRIDKKELIKEDIIPENDEDKRLLEAFKDWTSYFTGFHENRRNMYSADGKSTEIGFRIIDQNLPKFLDNCKSWNFISENAPDLFKGINRELLQKCGIENLEEVFSLSFFNKTLTQSGIEKYNSLIGGFSPEKGQKIQGLNELINLHCQKTKSKLPRFIPLYKQILSDRLQELSFLPQQFESDNELLESISSVWNELRPYIVSICSEDGILKRLESGDPCKIYIPNDLKLTHVLQQVYGDWDIFRNAWFKQYEGEHPKSLKKSVEKYTEDMQKEYKRNKSFSLDAIQSILGKPNSLVDYFKAFSIKNQENKDESLLSRINIKAEAIENLINTDYDASKKLVQDQESVAKIKEFLDCLKDIQTFLKQLSGSGDETEKDTAFYEQLDELLNKFDAVTLLYNKVRNYLTKKPYSLEKFKLNFDCVTLLDGWDENKEKDNQCILLRKNGLYYLGILPKEYKNQLDFNQHRVDDSPICYEKMIYKLLPGPSKMLPKVFFSDSRIDEFNPPPSVRQAYSRKKAGNYQYSQSEIDELIQFYQNAIQQHPDWRKFNFIFSEKSQHDLNFFYGEIAKQGYKISFIPIAEQYVNELIDQGKLYLFKIWNKDFSEYSKGTSNIHTLYWESLFDERNLADCVFKLNGEAEVFYRKKSIIDTKITHPANQPIRCRRNESETRTFDYPLIKDKRFRYDQYSFHTSITINFKADATQKMNPSVLEFIRNTNDLHIIGIDRGERNLVYISVIDMNGNIVEQRSLNQITSVCGKDQSAMVTDYQQLLDRREKENDKAQKSWQTVEKIKDIKAGFLSQVIHVLAELIVKYNAVICLEDLNGGFIRGRQKVDKSVYQQFEQKLIKKLQYLIDKKTDAGEALGVRKGIQLTNAEISQKGFQNGIIFYIPAWCTSKIDPVTGFVNLFNSKHLKYESIDRTRNFFSQFDSIVYNKKEDYFEFSFDYSKIFGKLDTNKTKWTVCSYGDRIATFRNKEKNSQWDTKKLSLTAEFKKLFADNGISLEDDLKTKITSLPDKKEILERLLYLFRLTLQMRNSVPNSTDPKDDYLISPVCSSDGTFFDSRTSTDNLPTDADANGAYNIARKGMWLMQQIKSSADLPEKLPSMSKADWLNFVQK